MLVRHKIACQTGFQCTEYSFYARILQCFYWIVFKNYKKKVAIFWTKKHTVEANKEITFSNFGVGTLFFRWWNKRCAAADRTGRLFGCDKGKACSSGFWVAIVAVRSGLQVIIVVSKRIHQRTSFLVTSLWLLQNAHWNVHSLDFSTLEVYSVLKFVRILKHRYCAPFGIQEGFHSCFTRNEKDFLGLL